MLLFRASRGARFRCEADFTRDQAMNLHFHDAARRVTPFHVSIRRDEKVIVVNRRSVAGWHREIVFPALFAQEPVPVEVAFGPWAVTLSVAGQRIGRFDRLPRCDARGRYKLRRGFPQLRWIAYVDIEGATVPGSVLIDGPTQISPRYDVPHVNDAFEVVLDIAPDQIASQDGTAVLRIAGFDETIPTVLCRLPYAAEAGQGGARAQALVGLVPGRVWATGADRLEIELMASGGRRLGAVTLTRAEAAQRIGALVQTGALVNDDRAALQAIEHARHAGILARLTPEQRVGLLRVAGHYRLDRYLLDGQRVPPPPASEPRDRQGIDALRDRFTATLRQSPQTDAIALLQALMAETALPRQARKALLIALTEWFCLNGGMSDLARLWRAQGLRAGATPPDADAWALSASLPLLYAEERFAEVAEVLRRLARPVPGWVLSPCIGWVAGALARATPGLDGVRPDADQRCAILRGVMRWVSVQSKSYWGRAPCLVLIDGLVALLAAGNRGPATEYTALVRRVLRVYALSPAFWAAVEASKAADDWSLPAPMAEAHRAFAELRALLAQGAAETPEERARLDRALRVFQTFGCADLARFRRDLFGPAGVPSVAGALPCPDDIRAAGLNPQDAALRLIAHPLAVDRAADRPEALAKAAQDGMKTAYVHAPKGPFGALQAQVFQDATRLLHAPDAALLEGLLDRLAPLADARGRFLGLGVALGLVNGLLSQGRSVEAAQVARRIATLAAKPADSPAPALAFAALIHTHPDHAVTRQLQTALAGRMGVAPALPDAQDLDQPVNPLLDTVVCVYTCRANLGTRVRAIREGWMRLLPPMGVPCLVFVGDGDGRREGDVVHLAAPDDYEGLPEKTLAMTRWVQDNTRFSWLVKVDDDCFLDPQAFFADLAYRKFDYYGRPLARARGSMDRAWHMAKSTSARGRLELDKSPEPSIYADGGSGYALSRRAMMALCDAAASPEGQTLRHLSFMEDKLVGDLLALRRIPLSGEDYHVSILRRSGTDGPSVPAWENGFLPFQGAAIKLVHLDGPEQQAALLRDRDRPWPRSHKVWPSFQPVRLGRKSNALDLVSDPVRLARVNAAPVAVVACLRNESFMIARFLDHYRALGVQGFLIADNGSDDGTVEYLAAQPDVALFSVDTPYADSHYGVAWQQALIANFRCGRWSLMADADEFLFWNTDLSGSMPDLVRGFDAEGATAARVFMLDMYPQGPLSGADFAAAGPFAQAPFVDRAPFLAVSGARGPFSNEPIWTSALRHRLIPGSRAELFVAQKYALLKYQPWMQLSAGLHFVANANPSRRELVFAHFKYNAAFRAKARAEVARRQHFNDAEEYRHYLALLSEGREMVFDPEVSVRFDACDFVRARCG